MTLTVCIIYANIMCNHGYIFYGLAKMKYLQCLLLGIKTKSNEQMHDTKLIYHS